LVPVIVIVNGNPPRACDAGAIAVSVGGGGAVTWNCTVPVVNPPEVTLTFLIVAAAPPLMVNVAVIDVGLCTATLLTVIPLFAGTFTVVGVVAKVAKLVPVSVTA
jgi:hypothetical protein